MSVTTVDIDPSLLREAKAALHVTTTRDAVMQALREVVLRRQQTEALDALAAIEFDPSPEKISYPQHHSG